MLMSTNTFFIGQKTKSKMALIIKYECTQRHRCMPAVYFGLTQYFFIYLNSVPCYLCVFLVN